MRLRPAEKVAEAVLVPLPEDILGVLVSQSRTCDRGLDGVEFDPGREENLEINYAILALSVPNVFKFVALTAGVEAASSLASPCDSLREFGTIANFEVMAIISALPASTCVASIIGWSRRRLINMAWWPC
jgi:hypothetical protein